MYGSPLQWLILIILLVLVFIIGYIFGLLEKDKETGIETYASLALAILFAIAIIAILFFGWDAS